MKAFGRGKRFLADGEKLPRDEYILRPDFSNVMPKPPPGTKFIAMGAAIFASLPSFLSPFFRLRNNPTVANPFPHGRQALSSSPPWQRELTWSSYSSFRALVAVPFIGSLTNVVDPVFQILQCRPHWGQCCVKSGSLTVLGEGERSESDACAKESRQQGNADGGEGIDHSLSSKWTGSR